MGGWCLIDKIVSAEVSKTCLLYWDRIAHVDDLVRPKPSGAGNDWNAFDYLEDDIPRCLSYMVHINRLLEDDGQLRLFSPLCLRMSWTPRRVPHPPDTRGDGRDPPGGRRRGIAHSD